MDTIFSEYVTSRYLTDSIIIQAVADVFHLKILIIESHPDFAEITIVEGVTAAPVQVQCAIFIGHMDEFHYVSTEPLTSSSSISLQPNKNNTVKPLANLSSFHDICSEGTKETGSTCSSQRHFKNYCLTQPAKYSIVQR